MMREAELDEMQRQWAAENERIMREHATLIEGVAHPVGALSAPEEASGLSPLQSDPPIAIGGSEPAEERAPTSKPQA